jgi:hypothetical protein
VVQPLTKRPRVLDHLVSAGTLAESWVQDALQRCSESGSCVLDLLLEAQILNEVELAKALGTVFKLPLVNLTRARVTKQALRRSNGEFCRRHQVLPFAIDANSGELLVAVSDPEQKTALESLRFRNNQNIKPYISPRKQLHDAIEFYYFSGQVEGVSEVKKTSPVSKPELAAEGIAFELEQAGSDHARENSTPSISWDKRPMQDSLPSLNRPGGATLSSTTARLDSMQSRVPPEPQTSPTIPLGDISVSEVDPFFRGPASDDPSFKQQQSAQGDSDWFTDADLDPGKKVLFPRAETDATLRPLTQPSANRPTPAPTTRSVITRMPDPAVRATQRPATDPAVRVPHRPTDPTARTTPGSKELPQLNPFAVSATEAPQEDLLQRVHRLEESLTRLESALRYEMSISQLLAELLVQRGLITSEELREKLQNRPK